MNTYLALLKTNKMCWKCGTKIFAGTKVDVEIYTKEKFYPVKGIMKFKYYRFSHLGCK